MKPASQLCVARTRRARRARPTSRPQEVGRVVPNAPRRAGTNPSPTRGRHRPLPSKPGRRAVRRAIDPGPLFGALAQTLPNRVLEDIIGLRAGFVVIAQAVIEEVPLPVDALSSREIPLPICDGALQARLARESDDAMQMIGHQQHQPAMPQQVSVIMGGSSEYGVTDSRAAKLIVRGGLTPNGNEENAALGNPLRDLVWEAAAFETVHGECSAKLLRRGKRKVKGSSGALGETRPTFRRAEVGRVVPNAPGSARGLRRGWIARGMRVAPARRARRARPTFRRAEVGRVVPNAPGSAGGLRSGWIARGMRVAPARRARRARPTFRELS